MYAALRSLTFASGFAAGLTPGVVLAHPHVWITAQAKLVFAHKAIAAVGMRWGFDELFSDYVRNEYDKDGNGRFTPEETGILAAEAFSNLREFGFLTHLTAGGEKIALADYRDFTAHFEGSALVYDFTLPLPKPLDPQRAPLKLSLYDDTFYIDIEFSNENPVTFAGDAPACSSDIKEDATNPIYFGMVNPLAARLTCASS